MRILFDSQQKIYKDPFGTLSQGQECRLRIDVPCTVDAIGVTCVLNLENGTPYIVFCHEWTQIKDGEISVCQLSKDLKEAVGEPFTMLKASDGCPNVKTIGDDNYVTDGPFMMNVDGELICLWSSYGENGYLEAIARSNNGKMDGKWEIDDELLFEKDGGHGMIFEDLEGGLNFIYHAPNETPFERPCIRKIEKSTLKRKK